jgi:tRNA A37 methylthiotransferase MiaB
MHHFRLLKCLMPALKTVTLGCKVNQYETQYAREGFLRLGYREAINGEPADLILVNSCTVTAESEAKTRKIIRRLAKKNPRAEIIVMGCYATRAPEEVAALPGVLEVIQDKRDLPALLTRRGLTAPPGGISTFAGRHRAWVKIQDGCQERCSYCIIPLVRPVLASRPADEVLAEIRHLISAGFAEIVLTGIHLGHYGIDFGQYIKMSPLPLGEGQGEGQGEGNLQFEICNDQFAIKTSGTAPAATAGLPGSVPGATAGLPSSVDITVGQANRGTHGHDLVDLLRRILDLPGDFRVRLSSIEAAEVTPELLELMADNPRRICPHLHLPLQSGSDAILKKMRRRYSVRQFIDRCSEIRDRLDQPALTTDVIVGFPGEREEDFAATCRAVEQAGFSKIHVFRFSPRQGTAAAAMPNREPQRVHQHWAAELAELEKRLAHKYMQNLIGRCLQVLVEGQSPHSPNRLLGTADRYVTVELPGPKALIGRLVCVHADKVIDDRLHGALI